MRRRKKRDGNRRGGMGLGLCCCESDDPPVLDDCQVFTLLEDPADYEIHLTLSGFVDSPGDLTIDDSWGCDANSAPYYRLSDANGSFVLPYLASAGGYHIYDLRDFSEVISCDDGTHSESMQWTVSYDDGNATASPRSRLQVFWGMAGVGGCNVFTPPATNTCWPGRSWLWRCDDENTWSEWSTLYAWDGACPEPCFTPSPTWGTPDTIERVLA